MSDARNIGLHWRYYLALEADLEDLARYIEFDQANFDTYSIELARLLITSSSEVDVLLKDICKLIDSQNDPKNIRAYGSILLETTPSIVSQRIIGRQYGLKLTPWAMWSHDNSPDWWQAYNSVKHERSRNFHLANLRNVLDSIAALLVVNLHFAVLVLQKENPEWPLYGTRDATRALHPVSKVFRIDDPLAYFQE